LRKMFKASGCKREGTNGGGEWCRLVRQVSPWLSPETLPKQSTETAGTQAVSSASTMTLRRGGA
jgi:hypothetical protein